MFITTRSKHEIEEQVAATDDAIAEGESRWPGMSYEQGVSDSLRWVLGETDEPPIEE